MLPTRTGPIQVVDITVRGGYHPKSIVARADIPLRLVFHREESEACSERVVFSSPRIDRHLPAGAATAIDLPAQPPGEVRYTCGMGRYRGRIRLTEQSARRFLLPGLGSPQEGLGLGFVVALCGLPLVALSVTALLGSALWPAMGVALLAWLVGCLFLGAVFDARAGRTRQR